MQTHGDNIVGFAVTGKGDFMNHRERTRQIIYNEFESINNDKDYISELLEELEDNGYIDNEAFQYEWRISSVEELTEEEYNVFQKYRV
jgi:antirestriction protein